MTLVPTLVGDGKNRTFQMICPGFSRLRFSPQAELDGKLFRLTGWKARGEKKLGETFHLSTPQGHWILRLRTRDANGVPALIVSLECRLQQRHKTVVLKPVVFEKFSAEHVLVHGRKMGGCENHLTGSGVNALLNSHFLIAISRNSRTIQLSHPLMQKDISRFSGRVAGKQIRDLAAGTLFDPCRGRQLRAAPVTISASTQGQDLMVNWAEAQVKDRAPLVCPQESGWNSWDYYRWTITEEEVLKNAEFIASDPILSRHIKRIVVDDGWSYCYGEWEANSMFPSGMKKLAQNLTRMGFTPGLWFAPTIAEPHSRFAQLHPEALTHGASGFPCLGFSCMERKGFILDPTHPLVRAGWEELFARYAVWGYRYFKLDFLAATVQSRRFYQAATRPGELMHHIIEPIRRAVGPESRILGCNFSLEGGPGLTDDVRISADIHARWISVKENVSSIAARFWAHERFWISDPDFAVCRGEETSDDPDLHRLKALLPFVRPDDTNLEGKDYLDSLVNLRRCEAEVLLSLVITSGGAVNLSDNLPRLNAVGLELLRKSVQAEKGAAAIPVDLFRSKLPALWVQKLSSGLHRVLLINWNDHREIVEIDMAALNLPTRQLLNFWTNEPVRTKAGKLSVNLPPHSCLLVESKT